MELILVFTLSAALGWALTHLALGRVRQDRGETLEDQILRARGLR